MSVSFIRIDDRMIHGQTCTRWAREYPCDGLIAVNDKAATNDVLKLISLLPGGYDARAEFLMSKKTLFVDFMPLQDKSKNNIVTTEGKDYYIYGYHVVLDERIKDHEAYLGDLYTVVGNMPEDVTITSAFDINTNSYKFLGCAMFDCKPSMAEAFVKLKKADA